MDLLSKLKQEGSEFLTNSEAELALNELEILFKALVKSKCVDRVVFDLSLARGLDYYTGVIFEAVFKGATQVFFYLFNNFFFFLYYLYIVHVSPLGKVLKVQKATLSQFCGTQL